MAGLQPINFQLSHCKRDLLDSSPPDPCAFRQNHPLILFYPVTYLLTNEQARQLVGFLEGVESVIGADPLVLEAIRIQPLIRGLHMLEPNRLFISCAK